MIEPVIASAQCWLFKPLLTGRLILWTGQTMECRESYRQGSFSRGCTACLPKKLFLVPLGQVSGEILLIQAYQRVEVRKWWNGMSK